MFQVHQHSLGLCALALAACGGISTAPERDAPSAQNGAAIDGNLENDESSGLSPSSPSEPPHSGDPENNPWVESDAPMAPPPGPIPAAFDQPDPPPNDAADATAETEVDLGLAVDDLTILVIFDRSGSMARHWDRASRWAVASETLLTHAIQPVQDSITVGALLFPQGPECAVAELSSEIQFDFMLGEEFIAKWLSNAHVNGPRGSTPLGHAFEAADRAITNAQAAGYLEERFRVIVVTDGEPNCETNIESLTALPRKWLELGVETHVLGLPGSAQAIKILDSIAEAGGSGRHQAPSSPEDLEGSLVPLAR